MKDSKDTSKNDQTVLMLEKHHRDGAAFAEQMEATFSSRFNAEFWQLWSKRIEPSLLENSLIVDFGTGPGTFVKTVAEKYKHCKIVGVECAPYMLDAVGALPENAQVIEADLQDPHLPIEDNSVDVAVSSVVVHEMIQPVRMFSEVHRVLKPGGKFYLFDWVRVPLQHYLKNSDIDPFDDTISREVLEDLFVHFIEHNRFSLEDLKFMLSHAGLKVIDSGFRNEQQHAWLLAVKHG